MAALARTAAIVALLMASTGCGGGKGAPTAPAQSESPARTLGSITASPTTLGPGYPGMRTTETVRVVALDTLNAPLPGVAVRVTGDANGGWAFPEQAQTSTDGSATFYWVPGSLGAGRLTATATLGSVSQTATVMTSSINPPTLPLSALNAFLDNSGAASGYSIDITPLTDPRGTYYVAMVWNGGYAGLQRDGTLYRDQLQFSAWNASGGMARVVRRGTGLSCVPFGGEGTGQACSMNYPWTINTTYRFEMDSLLVSGGRDISLFVTNMTSGQRRFIGTLFHPSAPNLVNLNTFVEQFHRVAPNCLAQPLRAYTIRRVMAKVNGAWQPMTSALIARQGNLDTICANVQATSDGSGARIQIGGRSMSDPRLPNTTITVPQ